MKTLQLLVAGLMTAAAFPAPANVTLPAIFGNHMVLQQELKVPIWGHADPGEKITVTAGNHTASTTAGADGKWRVDLDPFAPDSPPLTVVVAGHNTVTFNDVLIGDVWLGSGQSNMEFKEAPTFWSMGDVDSARTIAGAADPQLRLFTVSLNPSITPVDDVKGQWVLSSPETVAAFSAVAYDFAHALRNTYHRPIGMIVSCVGGTPARAWTSLSGLKKTPPFLPELEVLHQTVPPFPDGMPNRRTPTVLFNGMIAPLVPYGIKGVIWYQGEDDQKAALNYRRIFPRLINDWREKWGQGNFPFLYVQIAKYGLAAANNWALLQEAQTTGLTLPNTGMATAFDLGCTYNVHPGDKLDVANRLLLAARRVAYGEKVENSGPVFDKMRIEGSSVVLSFTNLGGGLVIGAPPHPIRGELPVPTNELLGFTVAGADKRFAFAPAKIVNGTVVVSSVEVGSPVAVRYAFSGSTSANLYSADGLPCLPFRTDHWDDDVSPSFPPAKDYNAK
jgi:sialate O-acetylesterase